MDSYAVKLISKEVKNRIMFSVLAKGLYEKKADVHGTCIKLFTDSIDFKNMWEDNFRPMLDGIRPHGRVFAISDGSKKLSVLYEPASKTVIIKNCDYYGWVKSIALALAADFFEDFISEHRRYSIHGSYIDHGGHGIALIGPSASGKTTLTYGLLLEKRHNFLTDDWFFVRFMGNDTMVFSAEKNSYIRDDLSKAWPQFKGILAGVKEDSRGRAVIDTAHVFGSDRIRASSNLRLVVLLMRDKSKPAMRRLNQKEALDFMIKHDFCNPHQLVRNKEKLLQRKEFFAELFNRVPVYLLNTIEAPKESLERIKGLL